MARLLRFYLFPLLLLLLGVSACVVQKSPVSGNSRAYGYSWNEELKIGREADQQIQQQYGVYDNSELVGYVEEVGQEVLSVSHMRREDTPQQYRNTEFYFRVLNSPVVNAFALPGGYIYVTRGLLSHLNNEAQLAVVLGHEIGHVAARHASQRAFEQQVGQIALVGGAIAGQELLGLPGQDLLNLAGSATQLLFLQYGRDDERESDRLGVEYSAMQNYQASEGAYFFTSLKRISEQSGQSIPSFLSTHPEPGEREKTIPELAAEWEEKGYNQNRLGLQSYLEAIDGIVYGNNPREGFTRDSMFYHPGLAFQFPVPENWQVINEPSRVILANGDGSAVSIMQIDGQADSPRSSVRSFLAREGVVTASETDSDREDFQAYEAIASVTGEDGTEIKILVYALEYQGNIYRFIAYSTAAQFDDQKPYFTQTIDGFEQLVDPDILDIQPVRLQVVETERSGTFQSFLPEDLPMEITAEELAIVNQVDLNEEIEAGRKLKIPGR